MRASDTLTRRRYVCACGHIMKEIRWGLAAMPICADCGRTMDERYEETQRCTAVHGDEIDLVVRHGICNSDGTPRRYRFKSDMAKEARRRGWFLSGETPK